MAPSEAIEIKNLRVSRNASSDVFSFYQSASVRVSASKSGSSPRNGFFFAESNSIAAEGLAAINASQASELHWAMWFENNRTVTASKLSVVDTQANSTGYILGAYQARGTPQAGIIDGVSSRIASGELVVQNNRADLQVRILETGK